MRRQPSLHCQASSNLLHRQERAEMQSRILCSTRHADDSTNPRSRSVPGGLGVTPPGFAPSALVCQVSQHCLAVQASQQQQPRTWRHQTARASRPWRSPACSSCSPTVSTSPAGAGAPPVHRLCPGLKAYHIVEFAHTKKLRQACHTVITSCVAFIQHLGLQGFCFVHGLVLARMVTDCLNFCSSVQVTNGSDVVCQAARCCV